MVVVVIIGVLVAIAIPVYNNVTNKAERSAIEANLRTIDGAIMQALASEDTQPADANKLKKALIDKYIKWPAGPGKLDENSYGIGGDSPTTYKAQVVITADKGAAGLEAGTYSLVGGKLETVTVQQD
jgi:type II secretory pathway pseudopilin PulG